MNGAGAEPPGGGRGAGWSRGRHRGGRAGPAERAGLTVSGRGAAEGSRPRGFPVPMLKRAPRERPPGVAGHRPRAGSAAPVAPGSTGGRRGAVEEPSSAAWPWLGERNETSEEEARRPPGSRQLSPLNFPKTTPEFHENSADI